MIRDTRAVSPAITQALAIGISTILVTGLLIGGAQLVTDQRESVAREGLVDVGSGITSDLVRLDQFDTARLTSNLSFQSHYPERIAGEQYRIVVDPGPDRTTIYVNMTSRDLSTQVRFDNETEPGICPSIVNGGPVAVAYNATEPCLEVRNG
ncbi:DUF7266 family protein [Haloarcula amylovorans]|uniref:DUF7266 family protein n=1 Tax=Haloarcula amylovorans TaxID=2562280 RepID=UPI0010768BE7|nr:hypothetical protein [Halomicroarcula amylolytica]